MKLKFDPARGNRHALLLATAMLTPGLALAQSGGGTTTPALDVTPATAYLNTNAGNNMNLVAIVVFGLAALAMAITWVKATFFG